MKKLLFVFLSLILLASCNNDNSKCEYLLIDINTEVILGIVCNDDNRIEGKKVFGHEWYINIVSNGSGTIEYSKHYAHPFPCEKLGEYSTNIGTVIRRNVKIVHNLYL